MPTRVGFLSLGSMSITLETWIAPGFSITPPPCPVAGLGRWWRLMMFSPSTYTRCLAGSTR